MNEEEKFIIYTLEGSINTYIEGTKVIRVQLTTKQAEILLNLISKLQKDVKEWFDIADNILRATDKYGEISIGEVADYISKLQKELEQEKEKNKKLNLENQALFESINCNDDNMLARRYQKLQKELDKSNKRINMCIDLLNGEGCLNFDTKQEKLEYIDKLIKLEEKNE